MQPSAWQGLLCSFLFLHDHSGWLRSPNFSLPHPGCESWIQGVVFVKSAYSTTLYVGVWWHACRAEMGDFGARTAKSVLLVGLGAGYVSSFARLMMGEARVCALLNVYVCLVGRHALFNVCTEPAPQCA
eukprot:1139648-Pelagomonas_calceolata.AAC.1